MRQLVVVALAVISIGACAGTVAPAPTSTPSPALDRVQIFYARPDQTPIAVPIFIAPNLGAQARLRARFDALAAAPALLPDMSVNMLSEAPIIDTIALGGDLAILDFKVASQDWGFHDSSSVRSFIGQVVLTATDERSVYKVRLTQNGGDVAVIAVEDMIVSYPVPLTREMVAPEVRPDHTVVYFARDLLAPLAVFLPGAGSGDTAEERVASRLLALENGPSMVGDAFNIAAGMKARLRSVTIDGDVAVIDYGVPGDDWGVSGSASIRALVQQLVFTASEEPGIVRVLITQNGGSGAVIGGEGLIVDRPRTRLGVLGG